jgi:hypothetical protein
MAARRITVYRAYLESGLPVHARDNQAFRDAWELGAVAVAGGAGAGGEPRLTRATATTAEERVRAWAWAGLVPVFVVAGPQYYFQRLWRLQQSLRSREREIDRSRLRDFKHAQSDFS